MPRILGLVVHHLNKALHTAPHALRPGPTVASLPDCTIMPLIRSSTGTRILGSMNMREPGIFQARSDTGKVCLKVLFFGI
jgi:hypothetical protein